MAAAAQIMPPTDYRATASCSDVATLRRSHPEIEPRRADFDIAALGQTLVPPRVAQRQHRAQPNFRNIHGPGELEPDTYSLLQGEIPKVDCRKLFPTQSSQLSESGPASR